jgi:hypothetical protein
MTNVKLEITCEVDGKRYRFVEDTWNEYDDVCHCERRCAFWETKKCPKIHIDIKYIDMINIPICSGVEYGHWEEIK